MQNKIKEDYSRQKDRPWSWFSQISIVKMAIYQSNRHVQCNSHQNSNKTLINPKVHLQAQETVNSQGNTEQKEQHYRFTNPTSNYNTQP
jgi:hypothetical protein